MDGEEEEGSFAIGESWKMSITAPLASQNPGYVQWRKDLGDSNDDFSISI